jgi:hypothetical protein
MRPGSRALVEQLRIEAARAGDLMPITAAY